MSLTWRDGLATVFVGTAAGSYAGWVTGTALSGMSTRVLGAVVFGLGWAACTSDAPEMAAVCDADASRRPPTVYVVIASLTGLVALVAGIFALASASEAMLAILVAAMVALWAMSTIRHAIAGATRPGDQASPEPLDGAARRGRAGAGMSR